MLSLICLFVWALGGWEAGTGGKPVVGKVGSYQGCSEALETLAHEAVGGDGAQRLIALKEDGGAERGRGAGHAQRAPPLAAA